MLGGLSAATAMVVVESVALSIMVSNNLVIPLLLRFGRRPSGMASGAAGGGILLARRLAIAAILVLAYFYNRAAGEIVLASIGMLVFRLRRANRAGLRRRAAVAARHRAGRHSRTDDGRDAIWAYALLALARRRHEHDHAAAQFPRRPRSARARIFSTATVHADAWRVVESCRQRAGLCGVFAGAPARRRSSGCKPICSSARPGAHGPGVPAVALVGPGIRRRGGGRPLSRRRAHPRGLRTLFHLARAETYDAEREADIHLLRIAEHLLASAIGAASSRLVLSLLLRRRNVSSAAALKLVDEASAALLNNRDMLQHALDFARQGISVFDADLRLTCWNREFREMFELHARTHPFRRGARRNPAQQLRARTLRPGRAGRAGGVAAGAAHRRRTVPRRPGLVRPGDRDPRRAHARRRPGRRPTPTSPPSTPPNRRWKPPTRHWSAACASAPNSSPA